MSHHNMLGILLRGGVFLVLVLAFSAGHKANDWIATILAGDGCGQVLDRETFDLISLCYGLTNGLIVVFVAFLIWPFRWKHRVSCLRVAGIALTIAFLSFGFVHWLFQDRLTACDIFPFPPLLALKVNLAMVIAALFAIYADTRWRPSSATR